jgi:hypothetical protein
MTAGPTESARKAMPKTAKVTAAANRPRSTRDGASARAAAPAKSQTARGARAEPAGGPSGRPGPRSAAGSALRSGRGAASRAADLGIGVARGVNKSLTTRSRTGESVAAGAPKEPVVGFTATLPFMSASLRLPGPGAVAAVGPVRVTLPTGALYYGGLAMLVASGALEVPAAVGAAVSGAVVGRRWLGSRRPGISVFDSAPGGAPHASGPVEQTPKR